MDFDFYRNFIVVAETGNISAAAKRLNLVQPALSAQIKTLEKYYQTQLFKTGRGKRHIELTEAGEAFLFQAKLLCNPVIEPSWCHLGIRKIQKNIFVLWKAGCKFADQR